MKKYWKYIFVITTIITFGGSIYEFDRSQKELFRLSNNDFQIRLTITSFMNNLSTKVESLKPIHIIGKLGNAYFETEFIIVGNDSKKGVDRFSIGYDDRLHGLGGNKESTIRFYAQNLTFGGLEDYPYLYDLDGEIFSFNLNNDNIKNILKLSKCEIDLFILGRHFDYVLTENDSNYVNIKINL